MIYFILYFTVGVIIGLIGARHEAIKTHKTHYDMVEVGMAVLIGILLWPILVLYLLDGKIKVK